MHLRQERVYLAYISISLVHHQGKSGQDLKQERELEAGVNIVAAYWLGLHACSRTELRTANPGMVLPTMG